MTEKKRERRARRKFTPEFKADVVKLCRSGHEPIGEIAKRLDLTETAVRAWVKQADVDDGHGKPPPKSRSLRHQQRGDRLVHVVRPTPCILLPWQGMSRIRQLVVTTKESDSAAAGRPPRQRSGSLHDRGQQQLLVERNRALR
jgi:transposase-like protein